MKKILLFSMVIVALQHCYGQDGAPQKARTDTFIRNLKWWDTTGLLRNFDTDLKTLSRFINGMNDTLKNYKAAFDQYRNSPNMSLGNACKYDTVAITNNIKSIRQASFYLGDSYSAKPSFLYYYTNKELNDYLESLDAVKREMKNLCAGNLNAFTSNNFLNAYYYMSESRSLLLAAMDNLERYYSLGGVADTIYGVTRVINSMSYTINDTLNIVHDTLNIVNSVAHHSDTLLSNSFKPYKTLKNKTQLDGSPTDKISTASNTILIDNRKNWWWRTLVGGVIGGLVAGLVVTAAQ